MIDGQKVFLNTSQTETREAKRELLQVVNQELLNNDRLKEKVIELLMALRYNYVEDKDIYFDDEQLRCKYACKMEFEMYRRSW
jgi:uncharacterized protein YfkK (UPF0435 family)